MFAKLNDVEARYVDLENQLLDPGLHANPKKYQELAKEKRQMAPLIEAFRQHLKLQHELSDNRSLLGESDVAIREMAKAEIPMLEAALRESEQALKVLLLPKDPLD